jgi:hypothetical protein
MFNLGETSNIPDTAHLCNAFILLQSTFVEVISFELTKQHFTRDIHILKLGKLRWRLTPFEKAVKFVMGKNLRDLRA